MKIVVLCLLIISAATAVEPLSRWDRFVCDEGMQLLGKNKVIVFEALNEYEFALESQFELENKLKPLLLEQDSFFHSYRVGILKDHLNDRYLVVDQVCYSNNFPGYQASVNSMLFSRAFKLRPFIIEVHTNRFSSPKLEPRDYLELIHEGDLRTSR